MSPSAGCRPGADHGFPLGPARSVLGGTAAEPPRPGRRPPASAPPCLVCLPVHASWLNQVRDLLRSSSALLTPNHFGSLAEAEAGLLAFQDYYQQIATPFEWKFTTSDLDLLLKRLAAHEPAPATAA